MISLQAPPTGSDWTIHCWSRESAEYPAELLDLPQPPRELYAIGRIAALDNPRVAIVGTRNCTGYGERSTRTLTRTRPRWRLDHQRDGAWDRCRRPSYSHRGRREHRRRARDRNRRPVSGRTSSAA